MFVDNNLGQLSQNATNRANNPILETFYHQIGNRIEKLKDRYNVEIVGNVPFHHFCLPIYRVSSFPKNQNLPKLLLTAGVHGNEKGAVEGALGFLENEALELADRLSLVCYPCINPRGYLINTRWNADAPDSRTDLNRNFVDGSKVDEVVIFAKSLQDFATQDFICSIDLHETTTDDAEIMAMQYPDRTSNAWEATPTSFYMYETCEELENRVGTEVIQSLKASVDICMWPEIFGDINSNGVIFYPEGAKNQDYVAGTSLDAFAYNRYSKHTFTTETYGDVSVEIRGMTQRYVVRLIADNLLRKSMKKL